MNSVHNFSVDGVRYTFKLVTHNVLGAKLSCTLRVGDKVIGRQRAAVTRRGHPTRWWFIGLGALVFTLISLAADQTLWPALIVFAGFMLMSRLGRQRLQFDVCDVDDSAWSVSPQRIRELRALPVWRRGLGHTARNLRSGLMLAIGVGLARRDFRPGAAQIIALLALALAPPVLVEFLQVEAPRVFTAWGVMRYATVYLVFFASVFFVSRWLRASKQTLWLCVALLSAWVWSTFVYCSLQHIIAVSNSEVGSGISYSLYAGFMTWNLFYTARALSIVSSRTRSRIAMPMIAFVTATVGVSWILPYAPLWYTDYRVDGDAAYEPAPLVDTESIYYQQSTLVADAIAALAPPTPHTPDLYFVGFGSYASQDVFMNEVAYVRKRVEEHFSQHGRAVSLINNPRTVNEIPLANPSNLTQVLGRIAQQMDVAEDVLFLYLTSHGSRDGVLAVDFDGINPNQLDASSLRRMLDESGIRWRIVVISACYSGSFIDSLSDSHTLVLTAAHRQNQSFGCSNDRELTYFAEHLFKHELNGSHTLLDAFHNAHTSLTERERREGYKPSNPQQFVGEAMASKLAELEAYAGRHE